MATTRPRKQRGTNSGPSPSRISDWLSLIRPHLEQYRMLPWGQQSEFIDKLSKSSGYNANTLRRYIAAAELLEGFGITAFPPNLKRLPVAAIEVISRISKKDPARGRVLLNNLMSGLGTIIDLKDELSDLPKRKRATGPKPSRPLSKREFFGELDEIESFIREAGAARWLPRERWLIPFTDWPGPKEMFSKTAGPVLIYVLLEGRYTAVFDERGLAWASSPAMVTREFLRNVAVAATMFDAVVVFTDVLQADLARVIESMRRDVRERVILRQTPLRIKPSDLKHLKGN
ncbi:MAG: hypothetical protein AB1490_01040 [Pseudomonadota bacterium]